jgi:hypothetical protein
LKASLLPARAVISFVARAEHLAFRMFRPRATRRTYVAYAPKIWHAQGAVLFR